MKIKPFKGFRPDSTIAEKLASYPYDVINSEEARKIAEGNPHSFLHVVKPEIDLPEDIDLYDNRVYDKAVENIQNFVKQGYLKPDDEECYYVYAQKMGDHRQIGLVACYHAEDYFNNKIKKHEFTRKDKEQDRTRHVDCTNANAGPVFLTYKAQEAIDSIVNQIVSANPDIDFTADDGISHTLWVVKDKQNVDRLTQNFEKIDVMYIADGHHRSASAANISNLRKNKNPNHTGNEEYNWFMAVTFPHNQLKILDYNRVVKDLNSLSEEQFIEKLENIFDVSIYSDSPDNFYKPDNTHTMGMYMNKKWYALKVKDTYFKNEDPVKNLDVSILQDNILGPVLGIEDPRTDKRIDFIGGIRGLKELVKVVDSGKYKAAFALYPTSIEELMEIADSGKTMPPKSTWFEPKLRSGMVVHFLD